MTIQEIEAKIAELKTKYQGTLDTVKTENRAMTAAETTSLDTIKGEIAALEKQAKDEKAGQDAAAVADAVQNRNAAALRAGGQKNPSEMDKNSYFRSIAKGGQDIGNKEVIADIVKQFNLTSPIFAAHANVQKRSTGNTYEFAQISKGGAGYVKTEGNAGTTDSASALTMVAQTFKTYSGQKVLVTQEAMDDAAFDLSQEVTTLGLAKATLAFGADCVTALKSAFLVSTTFTPTETAATSWAISDVVAAYYEIPVRNRAAGVKFICAPATAKALITLLTLDNSPQAAAIGLTKENIIEDDSVDADVLFIGSITLALAIGMKIPVRTFVQEVSEGTTFEVQPRFAVGLRDGTALAVRKRKAS
jgi:HK97 family phage major capsid protein